MNTNEELKPDQPGYKYAQLKKEPTKQDVIDYLKLKTRPDFDEIAKMMHPDSTIEKAVFDGPHRLNHDSPAYFADQWRIETARINVSKALKYYHTTHVEPLQAKLDKSESENQKLRDLLKDAHETLIIASLIDKSNTCRDSAARIDAFLKTKTNP